MCHFSSLYSDSKVDEDYCVKEHFCHLSRDTMCPDHHGSFQNRECFYKDSSSDKLQYQCLNRGDLSNTTIFQPENAKKTRFPNLLNKELEFNNTGFWCDKGKDIFLQWTEVDMDKLYYKKIPDCTLKEHGRIDAKILYRLLVNDLSFKGRKLVDNINNL